MKKMNYSCLWAELIFGLILSLSLLNPGKAFAAKPAEKGKEEDDKNITHVHHLTLRGAYTEIQALGFLVPLCLLSVPLFDVVFVSVARLSRGASPLRGSPDHFAVRLKHNGYSTNQVMISSMLVSFFMGAAGVSLMFIEVTYAIYLLAGVLLLVLGFFIFLWRLPPPNNDHI
mgnify:CR=1 FL=1